MVNHVGEQLPQTEPRLGMDVDNGLELVGQLIGEKLCTKSIVLVAVVGGSASGKTNYISPKISERFERVVLMAEDNYCLGNSGSAGIHGSPNLHKFVDYEPARIYCDLSVLKSGHSIEAPLYSYEKRERREETVTIQPAPVIIMEGCYLLQPYISDLFDIKVFINTDDHSRFVRRMLRPRRNPAQNDAHRIREYVELSYPGYHTEIAPYIDTAQVVIDNPFDPNSVTDLDSSIASGLENETGLSEIYDYIHPNMVDDERLTMSVTPEGVQRITYRPLRSTLSLGVCLQVLRDDYAVDLSRVGYQLVA